MADYTHIDMMAQLVCNLPALDVTERPRYPIQVRLIRFPERLLTRACSLIADGRPASTPCCRSRGRQIWLQCRDTGRSVAVGQWARSASFGRREIDVRFDGGDVSSDGGLLLLRQH